MKSLTINIFDSKEKNKNSPRSDPRIFGSIMNINLLQGNKKKYQVASDPFYTNMSLPECFYRDQLHFSCDKAKSNFILNKIIKNFKECPEINQEPDHSIKINNKRKRPSIIKSISRYEDRKKESKNNIDHLLSIIKYKRKSKPDPTNESHDIIKHLTEKKYASKQNETQKPNFILSEYNSSLTQKSYQERLRLLINKLKENLNQSARKFVCEDNLNVQFHFNKEMQEKLKFTEKYLKNQNQHSEIINLNHIVQNNHLQFDIGKLDAVQNKIIDHKPQKKSRIGFVKTINEMKKIMIEVPTKENAYNNKGDSFNFSSGRFLKFPRFSFNNKAHSQDLSNIYIKGSYIKFLNNIFCSTNNNNNNYDQSKAIRFVNDIQPIPKNKKLSLVINLNFSPFSKTPKYDLSLPINLSNKIQTPKHKRINTKILNEEIKDRKMVIPEINMISHCLIKPEKSILKLKKSLNSKIKRKKTWNFKSNKKSQNHFKLNSPSSIKIPEKFSIDDKEGWKLRTIIKKTDFEDSNLLCNQDNSQINNGMKSFDHHYPKSGNRNNYSNFSVNSNESDYKFAFRNRKKPRLKILENSPILDLDKVRVLKSKFEENSIV